MYLFWPRYSLKIDHLVVYN